MAGPYRTGKSYFLNHLVHQLAPSPSGGDGSDLTGLGDRPFHVADALSSSADGEDGAGSGAGNGADDERDVVLSALVLPGCLNALPDKPGTAVVLLDSPGLPPNR